MVSDIIEAKLFKEPEQSIKLSIPKYRCNLIFKTATFNLINVPKISTSKFMFYNLLFSFKSSDIALVYNLMPLSDQPFNYWSIP